MVSSKLTKANSRTGDILVIESTPYARAAHVTTTQAWPPVFLHVRQNVRVDLERYLDLAMPNALRILRLHGNRSLRESRRARLISSDFLLVIRKPIFESGQIREHAFHLLVLCFRIKN